MSFSMRKIFIALAVILALAGAGGTVWWLRAADNTSSLVRQATTSDPSFFAAKAPPTIPAPTATPQIITIGTSTQVLFTVYIPDPTLNPSSVNLLRVNANGSSTIVANMLDNGKNGDKKPGDKIFTTRLTLREAKAGELKFQASAAFKGVLRRALSPLAVLAVWNSTTTSPGVTVNYPAGWISISENNGVLALTPQTSSPSENSEYPGDILIFFDPNPLNLSTSVFYHDFRGGYLYSDSPTIIPVQVSGRHGLRFTPSTGLVGGDVVVLPAKGFFLRVEERGSSATFDTILSMLLLY
ncbi:MAG: hypothetical protein KIT09_00365 [Bryobacteraceae bacterium]|nr:hypothetical protein [Bryobacteraceae bacterium]